MNIETRLSVNRKKMYYRFAWEERQMTKKFRYFHLVTLEHKRSQLILDRQAIGTGYVPAHRYKQNFLDFFEEYSANNKRRGKRHLQSSFNHFKTFIRKKQLFPNRNDRETLWTIQKFST